MNSCSQAIDSGIERAKPLLGTTVSVRVRGLAPAQAHAAINAGFDAVLAVHEAMSFHDGDSDVSRLNRDAFQAEVEVSDATYAVIAHALAVSALTDGAFDITIAPRLVARGHLPRPAHAPDPDSAASWHDIRLLPDNRIRFQKPSWIDLGGIAKGFAVDRAIEAILGFKPLQAVVNAGGDLRIAGFGLERVCLTADYRDDEAVPVFELANGSLASSQSMENGPHIDPRRQCGRIAHQFVSVAAPRCIDADALTKVVLARGACSARPLAAFDAQAIIHDTAHGWRELKGRG